MEKEVSRLFANVTRAAFFRELAPELHAGEATSFAPLVISPGAARGARESLDAHGWFSIESLVPAREIANLARAVEALDASAIPTCFLFAYDEAWSLGFAIAAALEAVLGARYGLAPDVWAWLVPPIAGRSGWRAHRGTYEDERRPNACPKVINLWLALSDVTVDTACMHVVPIDRDPHFPGDLRRVDFDDEDVVALPAMAGTLLGWTSNALHFGGPMTARARSPRISLSYTLRDPPHTGDLAAAPSFEARIDLLAQMITLYGDQEGASLRVAREWAELHEQMRALGARRR